MQERMDRLRASRSQSMHYSGVNNLPTSNAQQKTALPTDDFFMRGDGMGGVNGGDSIIFDELSRTANYTGSRSALDN